MTDQRGVGSPDAPEPVRSPVPLVWPDVLEALSALMANSEPPIYLVGGAVRDAVLRRPIKDFDFVTLEDGRKWARRIADHFKGAFFPLDPERGVGRAIITHGGEQYMVDVARYRGETLTDDLRARDFTMNAVAVPMHSAGTDSEALQSLIDPMNGLQDLRNKRLRRCGPNSISDDPIRALRAVRQSVALNLLIEPETRRDLRQYGSRIAESSPERVRDEFMTMLGGTRPHVALRALDALGLLRIIVPEVDPMRGVTQSAPHIYDVYEHTMNVVERLEGILLTISPARTDDTAADGALGMIVYMLDRFRKQLQAHLAEPLPNGRSVQSLLMLAALMHDTGKPATRNVGADGRIHFYTHERVGAELAVARAEALRLSNDEIARLETIILHHMRPLMLGQSSEVSRRAIFRYWNATGSAGVDVCVHALADHLGKVGTHFDLQEWIGHIQVASALLDGYLNRKDELVSPPPLLNGRDLMTALSLVPGPQVGRLLALLAEAQAAGEIQTPEQALALASRMMGSADGRDGG